MMHAYQEIYLSKAQSVLGDVFDFAINFCDILSEDFVKLFLASEVCEKFENGEVNYLVGKSGQELVVEILTQTLGKDIRIERKENYFRSAQYWIGWALAYYQWYSGRKYSDIFKAISIKEFEKMYYTLHEADITKFVEIVDKKIKLCFPETNLKRIRTIYGCTQKELAEKSGVSLRSIQMYEQKNKDINKASLDTVYSLSRVLGCKMEDLIER